MSVPMIVCIALACFGILCLVADKNKKKKAAEEEKRRKEAEAKAKAAVAAKYPSLAVRVSQPSNPVIAAPSRSQTNSSTYKVEKYVVAGTSFRQNEIKSIGTENDDYLLSTKEIKEQFYAGDKIYQYTFDAINGELIPEPDNPKDPNAIRVMADDVHIGYIKSEDTPRVRRLMESNRIVSIDLSIFGGKCKHIKEDEEDFEKLTIETTSSPFGARVLLKVRPDEKK